MDSLDKWQQIPQYVQQKIDEVLRILQEKGIEYERYLIQQQRKGKSQYDFLLPKSRFYSYYLSRLNQEIIPSRQRKHPSFNEQDSKYSIKIEGNIQQVSVGAMCQFVKQLLQNQSKAAYEPFQNQSFYQQFNMEVYSASITPKVSSIVQKIKSFNRNSINSNISDEKHQNNAKTWKGTSKIDKFRKELGTQNDGSLGSWGGKKYQGLGSRNEFTDFRRQKSQQYYQSSSKQYQSNTKQYQSNSKDANQIR